MSRPHPPKPPTPSPPGTRAAQKSRVVNLNINLDVTICWCRQPTIGFTVYNSVSQAISNEFVDKWFGFTTKPSLSTQCSLLTTHRCEFINLNHLFLYQKYVVLPFKNVKVHVWRIWWLVFWLYQLFYVVHRIPILCMQMQPVATPDHWHLRSVHELSQNNIRMLML